MTTPAEYSDLYDEMVELHWKKEETVTVKKSCIVFMDDSYGGAVFLQQIIFWNDKGGKKDGWFYKSHTEWYEEVLLKRHLVDRYGKGLELAGILETEIRMANGKPTKHYRINKAVFHERWKAFMLDPGNPETHIKFPSTARAKTVKPDHLLNSANAFSDDHLLNSAHETAKAPAEFSVFITEDSEEEAEDREEGDNYVISTEFEKLNSVTPQDSVSTVEVSGSDVVKEPLAGTLHNVMPVAAQVFAGLLPEQEPAPVKEKAKPKKAAKAVKPPKAPKPPRELNAKELAFLAKIEQLNPPIAPDVKQRLDEYSRGIPWSVAQVFLLTGYMPRPNNWHAIMSLNGVAFDEKRMVDCYNEWTERGYHERGLNWLLEWYKAGGPPQYKTNGYVQQQQQQVTQPPTKSKIESDDPLVINFAQWIAAKPGYGSKSPYSIKLSAWLATNGDYDVAAQHIGDIEELHAEYQAAH